MAAVIAVIAGVRAGICMTPAPRPMVLVCAANQASTVGASDPYASATHACLYPRLSATWTSSRVSVPSPMPA